MNAIVRSLERKRARVRLSFITLMALLALGLCWATAPAAAEEATPSQTKDATAPAPKADAPASAKGQMVYLDENGNRIAPPPGAAKAVVPSTNRSSQGLVQAQSSVPGGGVIVDLKGRFRSYVIATKNPDGTISMTCTQGEGAPKTADACAKDHPKHEEAKAPAAKPETAKTETATANQDGKE